MWNKGIKPVDAESYYNAIECGKQGGASPACVFWDTGLCANTDFTLTWYTGYKQVAYEVWTAVSRKQPVPKPNFQAAQRQRVTIGVTQAKGASNALKDLIVLRAGKPATTFERSLSAGGGRFTFDYPAFAPTADVTIQMIGQQKTLSCLLPQAVLHQLRSSAQLPPRHDTLTFLELASADWRNRADERVTGSASAVRLLSREDTNSCDISLDADGAHSLERSASSPKNHHRIRLQRSNRRRAQSPPH